VGGVAEKEVNERGMGYIDGPMDLTDGYYEDEGKVFVYFSK